MFANKLHPCLGDLAMANEKEVSTSEENYLNSEIIQ